MVKKTREGYESQVKKGKKAGEPFTFLNTTFEHSDKTSVYHHILLLIFAVIAAKLLVAFITVSIFHSFVDLFDIGY